MKHASLKWTRARTWWAIILTGVMLTIASVLLHKFALSITQFFSLYVLSILFLLFILWLDQKQSTMKIK